MMIIRRHICLFLYLLISTTAVTAQDDNTSNPTIQEKISDDRIEEIIDNLDLVKTKKAYRPRSSSGDSTTTNSRSNAKEVINKKESEPINFSFPPFLGNLLYYLLILLAICAIVAIVYLIFSNIGDFDKKVNIGTDEISNSEEIEDIHELDLNQMLQSALEIQNYKLAIRAKFLMALKALSVEGFIDWSPEKTNRAYARELRRQPCSPVFNHIANIYERTWYGEITPDEDIYEGADRSFNELNQFIMNQANVSG